MADSPFLKEGNIKERRIPFLYFEQMAVSNLSFCAAICITITDRNNQFLKMFPIFLKNMRLRQTGNGYVFLHKSVFLNGQLRGKKRAARTRQPLDTE